MTRQVGSGAIRGAAPPPGASASIAPPFAASPLHLVKPAITGVDRPFIRAELAERPAYLRLDKNENLEPLPPALLETLRASLRQEAISPYPDLSRIYHVLANMAGVDEDMILVAAGSDLALKSIYDTFCGAGDEIVLHSPSYFMYDVYAQQAGARVLSAPIGDDWEVDLDAMLAAVTPRTKLVIVECPSGFTGSQVSFDRLRPVAERLQQAGVLLVVDEAYLYVESDDSAHESLLGLGNVILSRTLSKAHGLAGARVGFLVAPPPIIEAMARTRPLYELPGPSAWIAQWYLDHPELLRSYRASIRTSKSRIAAAMDAWGVEYRATPANFFLMRIAGLPPARIVEMFRQNGVLLRRPFDEPILLDWVRVTVPPASEVERFLSILAEALSLCPIARTQRGETHGT